MKTERDMASALAVVVAGMVLGVMCGCESGGSGGSSSGTEMLNETVSIAAAATHQTSVITGPGAGSLTARVRSTVGSTLNAWFIKVSDSSTTGAGSGADFNISTTTTTGETWRVAVFNPSGVAINTEITVNYAP